MPLPLTGVGVESHHRVAEEIVEIAAYRPVDLRRRVSNGPVNEVQVRVVRAGQPRRRAAGLPAFTFPRIVPELAGSGHGVELPERCAGCGVERLNESARCEFSAGNSGDDLVLDDERRARNARPIHRVADLYLP